MPNNAPPTGHYKRDNNMRAYQISRNSFHAEDVCIPEEVLKDAGYNDNIFVISSPRSQDLIVNAGPGDVDEQLKGICRQFPVGPNAKMSCCKAGPALALAREGNLKTIETDIADLV